MVVTDWYLKLLLLKAVYEHQIVTQNVFFSFLFLLFIQYIYVTCNVLRIFFISQFILFIFQRNEHTHRRHRILQTCAVNPNCARKRKQIKYKTLVGFV